MTFRVIEGGGTAPVSANKSTVSATALPGQIEAARLRVAVLALTVPGQRVSVEEAFSKLLALADNESEDAARKRAQLDRALKELGVHFSAAYEVRGQDKPSLSVVWPKFLLEAAPQLAGLHPVAHRYLRLA